MSIIKMNNKMQHQRIMLVTLALILSIRTTSPHSVAEFTCPDTSTCSCNFFHKEYEIQCPETRPQIIIQVQPKIKVLIECLITNHSVYTFLPVMSIGDVSTVEIRSCPLPHQKSIKEILKDLGIMKIRSLFIRSYKNNWGSLLTREHLKGLNGLERLVLNDNGLSHLPEDLFAEIKNLTWLDLKRNNVHLPRNIFKYLDKLEYLELGYNNLDNLEPGIFSNLKNLKLLNLWGNKLTNLSKESFEGISSITHLDLSANSIETLRPDVFTSLTNMTNLSLSSNKFRFLPENLFKENKKLIEIKLQDNRAEMITLPDNLFANLTRLKVVRIKCSLKSMPSNLFSGSSNLENITLSGNFLESIPSTLFADQINLLKLNLGQNKLTDIPDDLFANTRNLSVLNLSYNQFSNISRNVFSNLDNLKELYLNDNRLHSINSRAFVNMGSLEVLHLQNNQLTFMDDELSSVFYLTSPLQYLKKLIDLNLRNNSITNICHDWVYSMNFLANLDLSYNHIRMLHYTNDLEFLSQKITVNLSHNFIVEINFTGVLLADYEANEKNRMIILDSNPLKCDCRILHFMQFYRGEIASDLKNIEISANNLKCASPPELEGEFVAQVDLKELLCPFDSPLTTEKLCPSMCTCLVRTYDKSLIVNCSNANLTNIPPLPEIHLEHLDFLELYVENNLLTTFPNATTPGFANVTQIYARNNQINILTAENIPENLTVLDISENILETLNLRNDTTKLEKLYLSGNPWICDCLSEIVHFVRNNFKIIPDAENIQCRSGENMQSILPGDLCPREDGFLVPSIVVISILGLCSCVLAILYYKYQQEVKVWLFAHNVCLWFVTEEELDKDKKYDAFISYSHKDEDFVTEHLVPKLENGPNPFKLCLHIRDWVVGEFIPNQIAKSVEDSKRTIVVLSPNFLESIWGRMEFRAAHTAALSEGRARVIVIIYGDIGETDNLDPELNAYLKMNTYVKWNDPWFWDKLRYAMPHPANINRTAGLVKAAIKNSTDDKLELIKPSPVTPPLTTPPAEQASKNPLVAKLSPENALNGKLSNGFIGHVNGAFIINTNAKQSDV